MKQGVEANGSEVWDVLVGKSATRSGLTGAKRLKGHGR
jgi:hypothetical protein